MSLLTGPIPPPAIAEAVASQAPATVGTSWPNYLSMRKGDGSVGVALNEQDAQPATTLPTG